ncbi:MAG TPA: carbohydrate ABC transporter substrate-binding protein [Candidatus Avipropionibacterium avicola]|uniref:Carbohydrate ABC transporter substrate-binding protein n=1 Tax=Candidatus Avipropionibacterium avicola TaxID=2840701 RepID=A0A9D1GWS4_9ACTN|nr:carbohydrate ABC transporter substrate-binding protein [Candidatus Avipropionibacterium avicola]
MKRRELLTMAGAGAVTTIVAGCSVGSIGGGGSSDKLSLRMLVPVSGDGQTAYQEALAKAFTAQNPDIEIKIETQPGGTEGDNLTKTKLSTGEMPEVFNYNSGSLLQALSPDTQLVDLSDQEWVGDLTEDYKPTVSTDQGLYGAPIGTTMGGGVLYNRKVYDELGLSIPMSWDEFTENNQKIKAAGKTAIIQTFGTDWTAQLFVLADFANVMAQDPQWAEEYTANKRKYADQPALQGFLNQEETAKEGFYNEDAPAAQYDAGVKMLANGDGVHYPMHSGPLTALQQNYPDQVDDIGIFAIPAQDAADTRLTLWLPNSFYIPQSATGDKLEAAKQLIAFSQSPTGCEIQLEHATVTGPFANQACSLPTDVPAMVTDIDTYVQDGMTAPALEFLSPVKGPGLPNITVEVGRGIRSGAEGAELYDEDVKKQAQQLGLPGW